MYPGLLRTRISWHHFAQMILLFPKLFKTFSLSSKNAQRKLREIGPAVKVGSLNKSDKFYYLKQINFKESKTLPSDSVVIEAVGRPSAFEQSKIVLYCDYNYVIKFVYFFIIFIFSGYTFKSC